MATLTQLVSALSTFPNTTNLNNRSDNVAVPLGVIDNSANDYPNAHIWFNINLGSTCKVGGTIELYFITCLSGSANSSNWSDGISPIASGSVTTEINNLKLIDSIKADKNMEGGRAVWMTNDLSAEGQDKPIGRLPPFWTICVVNNSGSTLGTGHVAKYSLVSLQSA